MSYSRLDMMTRICTPNTKEGEVGRLLDCLGVWGQPGLHNECWAALGRQDILLKPKEQSQIKCTNQNPYSNQSIMSLSLNQNQHKEHFKIMILKATDARVAKRSY